MEYKRTEIIDTAKTIIAEELDISKKQIADNASFSWNLGFDSLQTYEFILEMEKRYNIHIKNSDIILFEKTKTLAEFCDVFYDYIKPNYKIENTNDVFKILQKHLEDKYGVMNPRLTDNFFTDLHFKETDRQDLLIWAEETFNIKIYNTYFINLDDFCDKIFYAIQRKTTKQPETNLFIRAKQKFNQLIHKNIQHEK